MSEISQWCGSGSKGIEWREKQSHPTKICFEINLGILLTWIWIRIHQILWIRIRIPSILIHIPARGQAVEIHAGEYLRIEMIKKEDGKTVQNVLKMHYYRLRTVNNFHVVFISQGGGSSGAYVFLAGKKIIFLGRYMWMIELLNTYLPGIMV